MIKVTVQYNDHLVDIHFPCSETTLRSALMEIHAADDNPPELFVTDVIFPEELGHLKDRFVNLDELNYLAKRTCLTKPRSVRFIGLRSTAI